MSVYIVNNVQYRFNPKVSKDEAMDIVDELQHNTPILHNGDMSVYIIRAVHVIVTRNHVEKGTSYMVYIDTPKTTPNLPTPQWVHNILNGTAEKEEILIRTPDYVVMPDPKWDRRVENLYLLALSTDPELRSLRDLRAHHVPTLRKLCDTVYKYIFETYNIDKQYIRAYVHFYPSTWRFHIHFQHISSNIALGGGTQVGKAHLLSQILYNLELDNEYYKKADIEVIVRTE